MSLRVKRHYKPVVMLVLLAVVLAGGLGNQPIVAGIHTAAEGAQVTQVTQVTEQSISSGGSVAPAPLGGFLSE